MSNYYKKQKKDQPTMLEVVFLGIGRGLWWLLTLPFIKRGRRGGGVSANEKNYIRSKRIEIENLLGSPSDIEIKHAVMEADKLVDHTLKLKGYSGETFADRLRSAEKFMDRNVYESLWYGHKIRNQIAHDSEEVGRQTLISAATKLLNYVRQI